MPLTAEQKQTLKIFKNNQEILIDYEDLEKFLNLNLNLRGGYLKTSKSLIIKKKFKTIYKHEEVDFARYLLNYFDLSQKIDHENRIKLDYRKCNLRIATRQQNRVNYDKIKGESKYKYVTRIRPPLATGERWKVCLYPNNKCIYIGSFHKEIDAAIAADKAALRIYGKFAVLNFPKENYAINT